jgi:4'-phosphopantetheinyl transferase
MVEKLEWPAGPTTPDLAPGQIDVWQASLDPGSAILGELRTNLSDDEIARALRFRFDEHRNRFIAARGILRDILGIYLGRRPQAVEFIYGAFGKPDLKDRGAGGEVQFNLSHSGELALFALAINTRLGIDVEQIRPGPADLAIAERFFSRSEVTSLRALPASLQAEAFFNCWTRKEAYVKALGGGLQIPLDSFDVSIAADEPVALHLSHDQEKETNWSLRALHPAHGYAAALVAEGGDWQLRCMRWQSPLK